jgi:hypothetical protein
VFDDPNLVSAAGLVPVLALAESAGLHDLLDEWLTVPSPRAGVKASSVIGGMLAGADCIEGLDLLRHGGMRRLFGGVRAPSTLGTFLRSFAYGHVRQLDAVNARLLPALCGQVPGLLPGGGGGDGITFVDVDDTVREVHGYAKQAAAFGYSRVRGLNAQVATVCTPATAPLIAAAGLRRGNVKSATGGGRLLARAISTARAAGTTGQVMARADSAYYGWDYVGTAIRHDAWFSVTVRMDAKVTAAISGIDEQAWTTIRYPHAIWDPDEQRWVSDAQVAEVGFTAFTSRRKSQQVACRLVVRRVKRLAPKAGNGTVQGELFADYRYHGFITNSTLDTVTADERHRDHAIVEQVIAELKDGPLAHLPSGVYAANAAWVACAVIAFNLARAAAVAAGMPKARWSTLREKIIGVPARIAVTGRRHILHLPTDWPWATAWTQLHKLAAGTGPPTPIPA